MLRFARLVVPVCIALFCSAHVGSPDAWFSGPAGPYQVLVHVRAPAVVPGIAVINIKPEEVIDTVTAFVNKYDAVAGGPPPDVAVPVANNPGWYRTELWVMDPGSNSVTVSLRGTKGQGTVVVPLVAVAARRLAVSPWLTVVLGAAALVLVAGMLSLVGAAVRESVLPPGAAADAERRRRAGFAMLRAAVAIAAVVGGLGVWWRAEDSLFAQTMYKPMTVNARVQHTPGANDQLILAITDSAWTERHSARRFRVRGGNEFTNLLDDHGKLMHLFVVSENGQSHFAHLHPTTTDSASFTSLLPPLPAGRYRVFADVLHASGFTQTLTTTLTLAAPRDTATVPLADTDDAWIVGAELGNSAVATFSDGATVTWLGAESPHIAGEEAGLRFVVKPAVGDTAALQPYLGMSGHAAVVRDDGAVFIHLHPMGTISVAAQILLSRGAATAHDMPMPATPRNHFSADTLSFPYAFPQPGSYTVWLQVKRRGRVQTTAFRATVVTEPTTR